MRRVDFDVLDDIIEMFRLKDRTHIFNGIREVMLDMIPDESGKMFIDKDMFDFAEDKFKEYKADELVKVHKGMKRSWRSTDRENPIHIVEYENVYEIHLDNVNPRKSITKHLKEDAIPHVKKKLRKQA